MKIKMGMLKGLEVKPTKKKAKEGFIKVILVLTKKEIEVHASLLEK